jgi:hypothetical protein
VLIQGRLLKNLYPRSILKTVTTVSKSTYTLVGLLRKSPQGCTQNGERYEN